MSAVPAIKYMSVQQYLEMENTSSEKHELIEGIVYAMAGADFPHNQITSNSFIDIGSFLKEKACKIYGSDLKVHVKTQSAFVYPDLTIVCNNPEFLPGKKAIVTNPGVIIEVLSPETESHDRGRKFMLYRQIPTLQQYILISSTHILVERYVRHDPDSWLLTEHKSITDEITIDTINYTTRIAELYRDVAFDETSETDC